MVIVAIILAAVVVAVAGLLARRFRPTERAGELPEHQKRVVSSQAFPDTVVEPQREGSVGNSAQLADDVVPNKVTAGLAERLAGAPTRSARASATETIAPSAVSNQVVEVISVAVPVEEHSSALVGKGFDVAGPGAELLPVHADPLGSSVAVEESSDVESIEPGVVSELGSQEEEVASTSLSVAEVAASVPAEGSEPVEAESVRPPAGFDSLPEFVQDEVPKLDGEHQRSAEYDAASLDVRQQDLGEAFEDELEVTPDLTTQPAEKPAAPRKYKPSSRGGAKKPVRPKVDRDGSRDRALPIEVRARFERGGLCRVSLLARRGDSFPDGLSVEEGSIQRPLTAMQEEWYQDVELPEVATLLQNGVVWTSDIASVGSVRWMLSGRDIVVLAPGDELSGFVSAPRLLLGADHVVLFRETRREEVEQALREAGVEGGSVLDWSEGSDGGWIGLGGVRPKIAVAPSGDGDILDVLRPAPDARISLTGGIRITRSAWLSGYPPSIRILGDAAGVGPVRIDESVSTVDSDGTYRVEGWDTKGRHAISCLCGRKEYEIADGLESWDPWDAYTWSAGDASSQEGMRPAICGLLVRAPSERRQGARLFTVPIANPLLVGSVPGQVHMCDSRNDLRSRTAVGYPPFEPVWAIPFDPLHCDKHVSRVLRVGSLVPFPGDTNRRSGKQADLLLAWARAVLDATRKGLLVEPADEESRSLWKAYRDEARAIWRWLR